MAVSIDELDVRKEWSCQELLFGDNVERPAFSGGELPGDFQFALSDRFGWSIRRRNLDQTLAPVCHLNQKIGHDVADASIFRLVRSDSRSSIQQLDLQGMALFPPLVPDGQRLFLDVNHGRAANQDCGGHPLQLSLTTDRSVLLWARHQQKGTGCPPTKPKRGQPIRWMRLGHGKLPS